MAVIEAEQANADTPAAEVEPPRSLRRRRHRMVAIVAVVAVIGVGAFGRWALTPDAFRPYGGITVGYSRTIPPGTGYAIGMVDERPSPSPDADIERVEARVTPGSAPVATSAVMCVPMTDPEESLGIGIVALEELSDYCSQVLPAAGRNLADFPHGTSLALAVVLLAPGSVTIRGIEVTYRQGLRRGTEVTGVRFRYRPPSHR